MTPARAKAMRQYVVYQCKLIELLHLTLLSFQLSDGGPVPENVMGHDADRFKETLLTMAANAFMSLADNPKSTNIQEIWKELYPRHAKAIARVWERRIVPGRDVMKRFRDTAGAHGDRPEKYFAGKLALMTNRELALDAMDSFHRLSVCLLNRQAKENPEMSSEIESVLLDVELSSGMPGGFNRKWLREMHLIESGPYTKVFR